MEPNNLLLHSQVHVWDITPLKMFTGYRLYAFNFTVLQFQDCWTELFTIQHSETFHNTGIISTTPERNSNAT
jgi:hypothetical protein